MQPPRGSRREGREGNRVKPSESGIKQKGRKRAIPIGKSYFIRFGENYLALNIIYEKGTR